MLHCRLDEIIIGGFDEAIVLLENIDDGTAALLNISLNSAGKTDIIRCQNKNLQVHQVTELFLINGVNSFEHDDGSSIDSCSFGGTLVRSKIVDWDVNILTIDELVQFLIAKFEIESGGVIEVVIFCVFMILITITVEYTDEN